MAIQVIWWIGLIGALVATLVVLKEVTLVLRTLRDIHGLARHTLKAARGVAENVAAGRKLDQLQEPADALRASAHSIAGAAASIRQKLGSLT